MGLHMGLKNRIFLGNTKYGTKIAREENHSISTGKLRHTNKLSQLFTYSTCGLTQSLRGLVAVPVKKHCYRMTLMGGIS